jgi:putative two-component system response regulator
MYAGSQIDAQSVLTQLRSTSASLGAFRRSSDDDSAELQAMADSCATETAELDRELDIAPSLDDVNGMDVSDATIKLSSSRTFELSPSLSTADEFPAVDDIPVAVGIVGEIVSPHYSDASDKEPRQETVAIRQANKSARIMIADDEPVNVMTFQQHLKQEGYTEFITTSNATEILRLVREKLPDVVLLDIMMPEVNGLDILRVMGLDPALHHIPVLVLTATADPQVRKTALNLGASDFLRKPIEPDELLPRVRNAVILKQHFDMVSGEAARLEQQVKRRTRQLEATRQHLIFSLARAAEHCDNDTGNHVLRVGRYTTIIAEELGYPPNQLAMLEQAAQLHDVGKIGIPDAILFKPDKLDPDEYNLIKKHCALGKQIIEPISEKDWTVLKTHTRRGESMLHDRTSPLLMLAARIAQTHHEKWDGSGYPLGLSGKDIPLEGRIVAVADVFDALSSRRPYKKAFARDKCFEILESGRGQHFDPDIVDAFFNCSEHIIEIQMQLMDEESRITGEKYVSDNLSPAASD